MSGAVEIAVPMTSGDPVSGLVLKPPRAAWFLTLAHGAGAGMRHPFLESLAETLAGRGVGTLRYQFPYMERGKGRPDVPRVLTATVRSAVAAARGVAGGVPLLAGGKSMGGRMTSLAAADAPLDGVAGLVFFGFPLHQAGKPSAHRGDHLDAVEAPMLFLQGTRDKLADPAYLEPVCRRLGRRAKLEVVEGADHSFAVLKRSGTTREGVLLDLAARVRIWADGLKRG